MTKKKVKDGALKNRVEKTSPMEAALRAMKTTQVWKMALMFM